MTARRLANIGMDPDQAAQSTSDGLGGPRASSTKTRIETTSPAYMSRRQKMSEGKFHENKD